MNALTEINRFKVCQSFKLSRNCPSEFIVVFMKRESTSKEMIFRIFISSRKSVTRFNLNNNDALTKTNVLKICKKPILSRNGASQFIVSFMK